MIEDILVLEEQDFNPSLVVVAVSGGEPCLKTFVVHVEPSLRYSGLVNQSDVVVFGYSLGIAQHTAVQRNLVNFYNLFFITNSYFICSF